MRAKPSAFEEEKNMAKNLRIATASPRVTVADTEANADEIIRLIAAAKAKAVELLVFPALCLTGATCGDLFGRETLLAGAKRALEKVQKATAGTKLTVTLGFPAKKDGKLANAYAAVCDGAVLSETALSPSKDEGRWFAAGEDAFILSVRSARVSIYPSAVPYTVGERRRAFSDVLAGTDGIAVRVNAGFGESTTDNVYSGYAAIGAYGKVLAENLPFAYRELTVCDVAPCKEDEKAQAIELGKVVKEEKANPKKPFLPVDQDEYETIMNAVSVGLVTRMQRAHAEKLVLGVSGGLDSTLALLTCVRALDRAGLPHKRLIAVSMPCFGTTDTTKNSATKLCALSCADARVIDIKGSVSAHLKEIGHNGVHDSAYENAQARMRTMVLMDIANHEGGLVVGTGDLSEEALGWCTYGGDHMANYNVNASIPKTLVKTLVAYEANRLGGEWKEALQAVCETDISPELLPAKDGKIAQKTEEIIGTFEQNDFFLYHAILNSRPPQTVLSLAAEVFGGSADAYRSALARFYKRFFAAQFKRSCAPDGVSIGYSLSPRGSLAMPSDAAVSLWLKETEK